MEPRGFICICPQKAVEFGVDRKLHKDAKTLQLQNELGFDGSEDENAKCLILSGGGMRVFSPDHHLGTASLDNCVVVFQGKLTNGRELLGMRSDAENIDITASQAASTICGLYARHGVTMISALQGQYAFCLYDAKQTRVLAVRDASGSVPLYEARSPEGSLVITSNQANLREGTTNVVDIPAGSFKYGWHASPRPFTPNHPVDEQPVCHKQQPVSLSGSSSPPSRQNSGGSRQLLAAVEQEAAEHLAALASPLAPVPEHKGKLGSARGPAQPPEARRRSSMDERSRRRSTDGRRSQDQPPRRHSLDCKGPSQEQWGQQQRRSLDAQPGRADAHDCWTRKDPAAIAAAAAKPSSRVKPHPTTKNHSSSPPKGPHSTSTDPSDWHTVHTHHHHRMAAAAAATSAPKPAADGNMFDALDGADTESVSSQATARTSDSHGSGSRSRRSKAISPTAAAHACAAATAAIAGLGSSPAPKAQPLPQQPQRPAAAAAATASQAAADVSKLMANLLGPSKPAAAAAKAVEPLAMWAASSDAAAAAEPAGQQAPVEAQDMARSRSCSDLASMMAGGGGAPAAMPGLAH